MENIAQHPHPIGTAEHEILQKYLLNQLASMGLDANVQTDTVILNRGNLFVCATVRNIVAKLSGTNSGAAILLVAHYDSVPSSFGAADDGVGVAAILETARVLASGPRLRNDVIVLLSDAEEEGLLGARAFVKSEWSRNAFVVLNFDARGVSGPLLMFESGQNDGWLIRQLAALPIPPIADSFMYEVYRYLPNNTDFSIFKRNELPGLNFAFIDGDVYYHSASDSVERIGWQSLTEVGVDALTLSRNIGNSDLSQQPAGDLVYFNTLHRHLAYYTIFTARLLTIFVIALAAFIFRKAALLSLVNYKNTLLSGALLPLSILGNHLIAGLALLLAGRGRAFFQYRQGLVCLGFVSLAVAVFCGLRTVLFSKVSRKELLFSGVFWWLLILVITTIYFPRSSYLFCWPILFALAGEGFGYVTNQKNSKLLAPSVFSFVFMLPGIWLIAPVIFLLFIGMGSRNLDLVMIPVILLLSIVIPALPTFDWKMATIVAVIGFALLFVAQRRIEPTNITPARDSLSYLLDAENNRALWASSDLSADRWTKSFLSEHPDSEKLTAFLPNSDRTYLTHEAPLLSLTAPTVQVVDDSNGAKSRSMMLRVRSNREAALLRVYVDESAELLSANVNGMALVIGNHDRPLRGWVEVEYYASSREGFMLGIEMPLNRPLKITVVDESYGLPNFHTIAFNNRPENLIPTVGPLSDTTDVTVHYTF